METPITFTLVVDILRTFGFAGLVMIVWWIDAKSIRRILDNYKQDMNEVRRMYESNVSLVKDFRCIAQNLQDVVIMNTQAMTRMADDVEKNQFCPMVRGVRKES